MSLPWVCFNATAGTSTCQSCIVRTPAVEHTGAGDGRRTYRLLATAAGHPIQPGILHNIAHIMLAELSTILVGAAPEASNQTGGNVTAHKPETTAFLWPE